jgi:uncharacterized protein
MEGTAMAKQDGFSNTVKEKLGYYVYRLIDPRNGQTFYVGKGTGDRVFAHVKGKLDAGDDALTGKRKRIQDIHNNNFDVIHVIHRHGMDEKTAREVESALIDAYPEASNLVRGLDSAARGLVHARQIIDLYEAKEVVFHHDVILININRSVDEKDSPLLEAVRYAWVLDHKRAEKAKYVLAVNRGLIIGVFIAKKWLEATVKNFPGKGPDKTKEEDWPNRWGFEGVHAPEDVASLYVCRRLPGSMLKQGAANPIRYASRAPMP